MLGTRFVLVSLASIVLMSCGADEGPTTEAAPACRTVGDLRLVYTGPAGEEGGDVFGLTRDGEVRRLTDDGGSYDPAFSPDGSRIVFSSVGESGDVSDTMGASGLDLYVMAADGSGRSRLVDGDEDMSPDWSPTGEQIAFVRGGGYGGAGRIFVVDPDGGSARALVEYAGGARDGDPAWSPDGTRLAFVRTEPEGRSHLMIAGADGADARSVLERPEPLRSPSWSPDGKKLVFTTGDGGELGATIASLDLDDGSVEAVADGGSAPVWSASGRLYTYSQAPGIADFSGRWRVAELLPDGGSGFAAGRAIPPLQPIGYLYGDAGIDVPRCDGPDSSPLTTAADVPEGQIVTDPTTGENVTVMPRQQALARLHDVVSGIPADAEPEAKLVDPTAPDAMSLHAPPGLVWVVSYETTPSGEVGIVVFEAMTGRSMFSTGLEADSWNRLVDLAP